MVFETDKGRKVGYDADTNKIDFGHGAEFEHIEREIVKLIIMGVMPDHVHLFIKAPPTASPHWIVQQLKGYTSHELRKEFSYLKSRLPTLWTRSYYVESCGHISEQTIKRYIEEQKNK